jgi:haloacetate dehalogenase
MTPTGTPTDLPDLFPGFETRLVAHDGLSFHCRVAGNGPALLCLHGYPQTHACWHRLAPQLTAEATVVVMDLRGYGLSDAPPPDGDDHATYSKRTMARDCVAVMQALGFDRFTVMGHDRGARVAYRLALDTPEVVDRVILLDIISTLDNWERMRWSSALKAYHWPFLAQPHPLPETLIAADPVYYLEHTLASWTKDGTLSAIDAGALEHYRAHMRSPARIRAMCEDYRAGASFDRLADLADRDAGRRIIAPLCVLWSSHYLNASKGDFDPREVWRHWADDVTGREIVSGHFLAEENPDDTAAAIRAFFAERPLAA